jgi:hypothetical protein
MEDGHGVKPRGGQAADKSPGAGMMMKRDKD